MSEPIMSEFQRLTISGVRRETPEAISVTFAIPPSLADAFRFQPGQSLALRITVNGQELRRNYSICSGPDDKDLRIAIKRVPGGMVSTWANTALEPGQTMEVLPPSGRFVLPAGDGSPRHILALAAGAGITPIIAMVKHALSREPATRISLFYGNRSPETTLFREELEELEKRHRDRFWLGHILSRSGGNGSALFAGRIDGDKVKAITAELIDLRQIERIFLCGPGSMIKETRNALMAQGFARERIHHEFFAPGGGAYQKRPEPVAEAASQSAIG